MDNITSIIVQTVLISVSLIVTLLRCWVRLRLEHRSLMLSDYFVLCGWILAFGWFVCSVTSLRIEMDHPLSEDLETSDSVAYLKTVFVGSYFFDAGIYFPKASIVAFFWRLIPPLFYRLRIALYVITVYMVAAFVASMLVDTLIANPISDNWIVSQQLGSVWNSYVALLVNWILNFSTDLLLFCLPFFMLKNLSLRRRQKIGLIGIFSVGAITMGISLGRFITYTASKFETTDASGNAWCTAEISIAVIVASLPGLKSLIVRAGRSRSRKNSHKSIDGDKWYGQHGSTTLRPAMFTDGFNNTTAARSYIEGGKWDDGLELVYSNSRSEARVVHIGEVKVVHGRGSAASVR